jgi:DNA polymerase-3 subunit beta
VYTAFWHIRWANTELSTIHSPYYLYYFFCITPVEKGNAVKFRCEREALAEALATASRAATGRTGTLPVLTGLRLELVGDQLSITGSDLDLTIRLTIEVGGEVDGRVVVPARLAADIVRSLGTGKVEVAVEGSDVSISNGRSRFTVRPLSVDDYPMLPSGGSSSVTLPAAQFGEALRQVVRAASNDESKKAELTGVEMSADDDGLRMVATDSYRLAVGHLVGHKVMDAGQKVIVPGRALSELLRLLGHGEEVVMQLGDRHASFTVGTVSLTTRLIEGTFPSILHLIAQNDPKLLTVEREALLDAIRRMKILVKDATPLRLKLGGDVLRLEVITQDVGNATEELDAQYADSEVTIAFNPDYLSQGVEACEGDTVQLSIVDPGKPAVLRGVGHENYLYLLMPVRVPG